MKFIKSIISVLLVLFISTPVSGQSDPTLDIQIGSVSGWLEVYFENSLFTAAIRTNSGGPTGTEHTIQDLILKSNGNDMVGLYIDACAFRGPATSAVITNNGTEEKTVRITYTYTNSLGIVDYTIFANSPIIKIDYIDYGFPSGWANTVDKANIPGGIFKIYGQSLYGPLVFYPDSYWNTYDFPQDPADGGELNYRDHMIMAFGTTGTSGYGYCRIMPIYQGSPNSGGMRILKLLGGGFETFTATGQAYKPSITGFLYLFDTGIENVISFGQEIVDAHIDSTLPPLPVELTSFSARVNDNIVELAWETATELNNYGFEVQRVEDGTDWEIIGFVQGNGNSIFPKKYNYFDNEITGGKYSYRLKQIDIEGQFEYSNIVSVSVNNPIEFSLNQNYPNPFNPTTTISFEIPQSNHVSFKVYDVLGKQIKILVNEQKPIGHYKVEFDASTLQSGVYFYRIQAGDFDETKKMILLK